MVREHLTLTQDFCANVKTGALVTWNVRWGLRCLGGDGNDGSRRRVPELDKRPGSCWVGVTFDEPVGKTDGTATNRTTQQKIRYFEAMPGYASFVRGKNVEVGDFPELDLFDEDTDSDEDEL